MNRKKLLGLGKQHWQQIFEASVEKIFSADIQVYIYSIEIWPLIARKAKENVERPKTDDMIKIRCADFILSKPPTGKGKSCFVYKSTRWRAHER